MPSLRRSLSSPVVRSTPYSSSGTRSQGSGGHRRSSGSETNIRRVLADLDWWSVTQGQTEPMLPEQEQEEEEDADGSEQDNIPAVTPAGVDLGVEHLDTHDLWISFGLGSSEAPVAEMAALAIAPTTPRRHALESSTSSLESTPDSSDAQIEQPFLDAFGLTSPDALAPPSPTLGRARPALLANLRTLSLVDLATSCERYADFALSPLSSSAFLSD
ncbi:unnamed protein product [Mycena citricolor]|uniref:Uncharacterized protein n=1 Tax=Mycena citricolor TaxID=2018698 RepID=A0AAD2GYS8_9AGAR|nr:unnamed protein product [Mycena citricolor]CAK5264933.1 unnamed protein product [Mycena citricolor]CAK5277633.1 unnamed protein product [Mycena citricolor]